MKKLIKIENQYIVVDKIASFTSNCESSKYTDHSTRVSVIVCTLDGNVHTFTCGTYSDHDAFEKTEKYKEIWNKHDSIIRELAELFEEGEKA